jgi:hypothetical protein
VTVEGMMVDMGHTAGFFEEDEPLDQIVRAFDEGEHGVTEPPHRGRTMYLDVTSFEVSEAVALPLRELAGH